LKDTGMSTTICFLGLAK